ncbi:MAG: hypothetical protein JWN69_2587 [Alphaproteobacteria bacterium]|nr:hypothetical protein [Alphaproteobacteria bacterium]
MTNHLLRGGACAAVVAAGFFMQPAQAAMNCWNPQHVAAAKIRDLQSRLMVATMRCNAMGINVLPAYNDFVRTNRSTIQDANGVIKAQFAKGFGAGGQTEYDRFTTVLANAYGADPTSASICRETASRAHEAVAAQGDVQRLLEIADSMGSEPSLPGGRCKVSFAAVGE